VVRPLLIKKQLHLYKSGFTPIMVMNVENPFLLADHKIQMENEIKIAD
jgi:hypothetical protein